MPSAATMNPNGGASANLPASPTAAAEQRGARLSWISSSAVPLKERVGWKRSHSAPMTLHRSKDARDDEEIQPKSKGTWTVAYMLDVSDSSSSSSSCSPSSSPLARPTRFSFSSSSSSSSPQSTTLCSNDLNNNNNNSENNQKKSCLKIKTQQSSLRRSYSAPMTTNNDDNDRSRYHQLDSSHVVTDNSVCSVLSGEEHEQDGSDTNPQDRQDHSSECSNHSASPSTSPSPRDSLSPNGRQRRAVQWERIEVRLFELCLGDNPAVSNGLPCTLTWDPFDYRVLTLDEYEAMKQARQSQKLSSSSSSSRRYSTMILPASVRKDLLRQGGHQQAEFDAVSLQVQRIQHERTQSAKRTLWERLRRMNKVRQQHQQREV